jgi:hypothetical protein
VTKYYICYPKDRMWYIFSIFAVNIIIKTYSRCEWHLNF